MYDTLAAGCALAMGVASSCEELARTTELGATEYARVSGEFVVRAGAVLACEELEGASAQLALLFLERFILSRMHLVH